MFGKENIRYTLLLKNIPYLCDTKNVLNMANAAFKYQSEIDVLINEY